MTPHTHPRWVEAMTPSTQSRAHLLSPDATFTRDQRAWCGATVDGSKEAPYLVRCKSCLQRAERYTSDATVQPPTRVVTRLQLDIEHNADQTADDVLATALRRVVPQPTRSSLHVTGEVVSSHPKEGSA